MIELSLTVLSFGVVALLACFAIRRVVLLAAAMMPAPPVHPSDDPPLLTLVVPAWNEAAEIGATLDALASIEYPPDRLFVVLVNDGSDDLTGEYLARWAARRSHAVAVDLGRRVGRPEAVNRGIAAAPATRLVAVCDGDVRMRPDYLLRLAGAFADESVGAATGFLAPSNAIVSPVARYAAVESWVHQLIGSAGKERLDLNPPTLGASMFRRAALEQIGGFGAAPSGDDVRATIALTRAGWRTRFDADAIAETRVVANWRDYWRQHGRWTRDLFSAGSGAGKLAATVGVARRLESVMLSSGYSDRLLLAVAIGLAGADRVPFWLPVAYLALAAVEVLVASIKAGAAWRAPAFVLWTAVFFALDVAATFTATAAHLLQRPRTLHTSPRAVPPQVRAAPLGKMRD